MKEVILSILEKRRKHFEDTHHKYEERDMANAIAIIKANVPPELFKSIVFDDDYVKQLEDVSKTARELLTALNNPL